MNQSTVGAGTTSRDGASTYMGGGTFKFNKTPLDQSPIRKQDELSAHEDLLEDDASPIKFD